MPRDHGEAGPSEPVPKGSSGLGGASGLKKPSGALLKRPSVPPPSYPPPPSSFSFPPPPRSALVSPSPSYPPPESDSGDDQVSMDTSKPGKGPKKRPKDASSGHSEEDRGRRIPMNDEGWEKKKKKKKTEDEGAWA